MRMMNTFWGVPMRPMRASFPPLSRGARTLASEAGRRSYDAVVCGAGIAGVSCAHYLARSGASVRRHTEH